MKNYGIIELFAGAGGMALGFEKAGFKPILLVEKDKDACFTLLSNRPNWPVFGGDVSMADYSGKEPTVVTGGFPCQSFSHAGRRLGLEDTRGTLFYEFARCIKETSPKIFVGENVHGLITHDKGKTFKVVLDVLSGLGYNVEYELLNAYDYGVPQKRNRLIIVGYKNGIKFGWPPKCKKHLSLKDAIFDCPLSEGSRYSERKTRVLEMVPPGGNWRNLPADIAKEYMGKSYYNEGGRTTYARRLSWDEPCLTIVCSPSQMQTERCHPDETRPLTVRESARIQTFPDEWIFYGSVSSKYRQIGNAVPVQLAFAIATAIKLALDGKTKISEDLFDY